MEGKFDCTFAQILKSYIEANGTADYISDCIFKSKIRCINILKQSGIDADTLECIEYYYGDCYIKNPHYDANGKLDGGEVFWKGQSSGHIDPSGEPGVKGICGV